MYFSSINNYKASMLITLIYKEIGLFRSITKHTASCSEGRGGDNKQGGQTGPQTKSTNIQAPTLVVCN
jgi:hypothetical protein